MAPGRACGGLEQAGEWAGGHAGADVLCVAGVLRGWVCVERDHVPGVADAVVWATSGPEVDDQVAGVGVAQVVEAK